MIIQHPDLGPRDSSEFVYKGDAELLFSRGNNPAGKHCELWYHEYGDRSWLVVTRDTTNHEILKVEHVEDYIKSYKAK